MRVARERIPGDFYLASSHGPYPDARLIGQTLCAGDWGAGYWIASRFQGKSYARDICRREPIILVVGGIKIHEFGDAVLYLLFRRGGIGLHGQAEKQ